MSIQKRLNELKPYVKGIRFAQELPIVDAVFSEKWSVTDTVGVKYNPSKKTAGYFMFYGENPLEKHKLWYLWRVKNQ